MTGAMAQTDQEPPDVSWDALLIIATPVGEPSVIHQCWANTFPAVGNMRPCY